MRDFPINEETRGRRSIYWNFPGKMCSERVPAPRVSGEVYPHLIFNRIRMP